MIKQVIKFSNGTYWYHYQGWGTDLQKAWTFNRTEDALNTIKDCKLFDCEIVQVNVQFGPFRITIDA